MKISKGWYLKKNQKQPVYVTSVKSGRVYWDIGNGNRSSEPVEVFIKSLQNQVTNVSK